MFIKRQSKTHLLRHRIKTKAAQPRTCNARHISAHKGALPGASLMKMMDTGAVRESNIPWTSPVVFALEKHGTARLCVTCIRLKEVMINVHYFPSNLSVIYTLGDATLFTTLDCRRGLPPIVVHPADVQNTAFVCHRRLLKSLAFGLSNSPKSFQRSINVVLCEAKYCHARLRPSELHPWSNCYRA